MNGNHLKYSSDMGEHMGDLNTYQYENSDSENEIQPEPNGRGAPSADTRKRQAQEETVRIRINQAKQHGSIILELNNLGIQKIPPELLELRNLECLYMEGNELTSLPEDFFDCLPNLQWLDLRQNYLSSIPSTYIGRHRCLRNLLLEGNDLKTLPLELGLVTNLSGLNISNNPLEFPPESVIEGGTKSILAFFRDLLRAKSEAGYGSSVPRIEDMRLADSEEGYSSGSEEIFGHRNRNTRNSGQSHRPSLHQQSSHDSARDSEDDLIGPVPQSASLHRQRTYNEIRQMQLDKFKKAGALGTLDKKSRFYPHVLAPSQTRLTSGQSVRLDRDSGIPYNTPKYMYHHSNLTMNRQSVNEKKPTFNVINMNNIAIPKSRYLWSRNGFMF